MENTNRLEFIKQEMNAILNNQKKPGLDREGFLHLYGVAQNCSLLAMKRKLNVELCTIIGLMHDIYTYKYGYVKEHAILGAKEVEKILESSELFTQEEIDIVKTAISFHSNKKIKHDKYSELIKDADVLQNALYRNTFAVKHRKRLKKALKTLGIKMKNEFL